MHALGLWSVSLSLITGGTALLVDRWEPRRVARLLAEVLPEPVTETAEVLGLPLLAQWGMTEGGLILTSPDDPPDWAARSLGRPGIGTEAELRPVTAGAPVNQENPGRLMIRGASVCLGTMGRDSGTLQVLAEHDEG
ncbi:MAG: cyclohexanecarboxylate-CoA ligase [Streptosporangiaceae bacterium]|jgi:cyclohexanecarboxylate-CoA ligase|nr:cyclohexanecarboxylate-CoA ligase [Streptosporangiaceae bacterium]